MYVIPYMYRTILKMLPKLSSEPVVQMAIIIHRVKRWKKRTKIRIMTTTDSPEDSETASSFVKALLEDLRITAAIVNVDLDEDPESTKDFVKLNAIVRSHSEHSCLILTSLPAPPRDPDHAASYLESV